MWREKAHSSPRKSPKVAKNYDWQHGSQEVATTYGAIRPLPCSWVFSPPSLAGRYDDRIVVKYQYRARHQRL